METHAHELHKAPGHGWKHYFFEFFMLFLAVFCGFLAENFREELVQHRQEREFMQSMMEDLQTDTSKLTHQIAFGKMVSSNIENLISLLNDEEVKDSTEKLYFLNRMAGRIVRVEFEDRTSSQLKNAGNMRLIRNKRVVDSIRNYWSTMKIEDDIEERLQTSGSKAGDISMKLFYTKYYHYTNRQDPLNSQVTVLPGAKLINNDPALLAEYANRRQSGLFILNNYIVNLQKSNIEAANLLQLIRKEYHFENQ